jgi:hypothetical protein
MHFTTTLLTREMGDVTLAWTEEQAAVMEDYIQKKIEQGHTFFIIEEGDRHVRLRAIGDLQGRRSVTIGDKEAEALIAQGKIGIVDVGKKVQETSEMPQKRPARRARSAKEAARSQTVATPASRGG